MCCSPYVPHDPPISFSLTWYNTNNIWWAVQTMKLLTAQSSPFFHSLSLLGPNVLSEVVRDLRVKKILTWMYQSYFNVVWHKTVVCVGAMFVPRRTRNLHYMPNRLTEVKVWENGGIAPHSLNFVAGSGRVLRFQRLYTQRKITRHPLL